METIEMEAWKSIPGYSRYEISDFGRVRSYWARMGRGRGWSIATKPSLRKNGSLSFGYPSIVLISDEARRKQFPIHSLVLTVFVGPRDPGMVARHLDGDRKNSRLSNLSYGTYSQNEADKKSHGTASKKSTTASVREIRRRAIGGESRASLSAAFNLSAPAISKIVLRQRWSEVV